MLEPFRATDDFGSEITLLGAKYSRGYGISSVSLINVEYLKEKGLVSLSPNVKFWVEMHLPSAIVRLFYKTRKSALVTYKALIEVAKKEDD